MIVMTLVLMVGFFGVATAKDLVSSNVTTVDEYTIKGDKHFHTAMSLVMHMAMSMW